jgi:hypothetical protein
MIYWALGPFVRSFTLLVDPGDIYPPQMVTGENPEASGRKNDERTPKEADDKHKEESADYTPRGRWSPAKSPKPQEVT